MKCGEGIIGFHLDSLPDFLADHTMLATDPRGRLEEHCLRWIQFINGLWSWSNQATFCLRYVATPFRRVVDTRKIDVFLLARADNPKYTRHLGAFLESRLQAYELLPRRIGTAARLASWQLSDESISSALTLPDKPVLLEVFQRFEYSLWGRSSDMRVPPDQEPKLDVFGQKAPGVLLPWWGPGGAFTMPMEVLLVQSSPTALSINLRPVKLLDWERAWFRKLAARAESLKERTRKAVGVNFDDRRLADPAAGVVARLYLASVQRLLSQPFEVIVQCLAGCDDFAAVRGVASAVQALTQEPSFHPTFENEQSLPCGAEIIDPEVFAARRHTESNALGLAKRNYSHLEMNRWALTYAEPNPLQRMRYLLDARGAATVFRFPVSVEGGVPGITVRQRPPDFQPGPNGLQVGDPDRTVPTIVLGTFHSGGVACLDGNAFRQHALVTGFTGSGKSNTLRWLLHQFWPAHQDDPRVPFLVIESAKHEYRGLLRVKSQNFVDLPAREGEVATKQLLIYTLGNELCAPFRLNPFELIPGIRLETHLGRLRTCFEAALPQEGPLPSLVTEAIQLIYEDLGWALTDEGPPRQDCTRRFPRMNDLLRVVQELIGNDRLKRPTARGYQGETLHNVLGFALGRLRPLTLGSIGLMFDIDRTVDPDELFSRPAVLEMNDLNEQDKSLVMMFLLMLLREYRELHSSDSLCHITVVEEAHNVLENTSSNAASHSGVGDTKFKAVQAFCNMLAEVRALGEGLIIADQSPEKLAPDAMRNTNIQIGHQLRDSRDRRAIAAAMLMSNEQQEFLGKLAVGHCAVFCTGLEKATYVRVPAYAHCQPDDELSGRGLGFCDVADPVIKEHMHTLTATYMTGPLGDACSPCRCKCDFRRRIYATAYSEDSICAFRSLMQTRRAFDEDILRFFAEVIVPREHLGNLYAAWCAYIHAMDGERRRGSIKDAARSSQFDGFYAWWERVYGKH